MTGHQALVEAGAALRREDVQVPTGGTALVLILGWLQGHGQASELSVQCHNQHTVRHKGLYVLFSFGVIFNKAS